MELKIENIYINKKSDWWWEFYSKYTADITRQSKTLKHLKYVFEYLKCICTFIYSNTLQDCHIN